MTTSTKRTIVIFQDRDRPQGNFNSEENYDFLKSWGCQPCKGTCNAFTGYFLHFIKFSNFSDGFVHIRRVFTFNIPPPYIKHRMKYFIEAYKCSIISLIFHVYVHLQIKPLFLAFLWFRRVTRDDTLFHIEEVIMWWLIVFFCNILWLFSGTHARISWDT